MGYCTYHTLEIQNPEHDNQLEEIIAENEEIRESGGFDTDGSTMESTKWYSHADDMRELSLKYPSLVFKLYGEGEETGDLWHEYYKNGKMQHCPAIITYEEYNEEELL